MRFSTAFVLLWAFPAVASPPWWDLWPRNTACGDLACATRVGANWVNAAEFLADEGRAPYFRETSYRDGEANSEALKAAGIKRMAWLEGQGQTRAIIAAVHRNTPGEGTGEYRINSTYAAADLLSNNWSWDFTGPAVNADANAVVWLGIPSFVNGESWLGPFTNSNPLYGVVAPTWPDGRLARDAAGTPVDPRQSQVYLALAAQDVNGAVESDSATAGTSLGGKLELPVDGKLQPVGDFSIGKDQAAPFWVDYNIATARYFLSKGLDGFWVDNVSGFDSLTTTPIRHAFGEWSVAGFRQFAASHPALGLADPAHFDVRVYLKSRFAEWFPGRDSANLDDAGWTDARWLSDPIWMAYLSYKSKTDGERARQMYAGIKAAAASLGRDPNDICVGGNDVPAIALGAIQGTEMDMVDTEYSPGWSLDQGSIGRGLPNEGGHTGPFYAAATRFARSRHAVVWYYLEGEQEKLRGHPGLGELLGYEALANNVLLNSGGDNTRLAGNDLSAARVNAVTARFAPRLDHRERTGSVAILYSTETQNSFLAPGGFQGFERNDGDPEHPGYLEHNLGYQGWAMALEDRHIPYRVIPDFRLSAAELKGVTTLILPHVRAVEPAVVESVLVPFARSGGAILITGTYSGELRSQEGLYSPNGAKILAALVTRDLKPGKATLIAGNPGFDYAVSRVAPYVARRAQAATRIQAALTSATQGGFLKPELDLSGLPGRFHSVYHREEGATVRLLTDLVNLDFSSATDLFTSNPGGVARIRVPTELAGRALSATFLETESAGSGSVGVPLQGVLKGGWYTVTVPAFRAYGSLVLEAASAQSAKPNK